MKESEKIRTLRVELEEKWNLQAGFHESIEIELNGEGLRSQIEALSCLGAKYLGIEPIEIQDAE